MRTQACRIIKERFLDIAWVLFVASQLITMTAWYAMIESDLKVIVYKGVSAVSCILCLAVIAIKLICREYKLKTFICYAIFGLVCLGSWFYSRDNIIIWMFVLLMAAYNSDSRRIIGISSVIAAVVLFAVIIASRLNLIENMIYQAGGRIRHGMGFVWVTTGPTIFFFLMLQYIFLRKNKMRLCEYAAGLLINVYLYVKTGTRLPFFLLTAAILFFAAVSLFKKKWRISRRAKLFFYLIPVLICAASILICAFFRWEDPVWHRINTLLNSRPHYGAAAFREYGVNLFGRQIEWVGNSIIPSGGTYNYVDCSYVRILLNFGALFLTAVLAVYYRLLYRAVRAEDFYLVWIAVFTLLHGFTEPTLFDMGFNVFPMIAFASVGTEPVEYKKGFLKELFS
ncbi:MAG: hypothetical protein ACOX75_06675 [Lachnospiraceae bacterium]|jgi:hypothetical protein